MGNTVNNQGGSHVYKSQKKDARKTDADLAAEVTELVGYEVGRALVNHWFRGKRTPDLVEFMALCTALGADPGHILLNVRMAFHLAPEGSQMASALRQRGQSPAYLKKSAKRLKASKPAKPVKSKVPA